MGEASFEVSLSRHWMSGAVCGARGVWRGLGNLETKIVGGELKGVGVERPVYVCGLARAGTSVMTEVVASHPSVATHQYRDFPFLFIPYWWRQTLARSAKGAAEAAAERAHGDRLMVTSSSPEAFEEVLWTSFFGGLHDSAVCNVLDGNTTNPGFEGFYRDHVRKLLAVTKRSRYAAKGNYNLTRMEYLLKVFPDARFVVVVRRPREHVASLVKQHRIFSEAASKYPRSVAHLDRVGHFEFGAHRRAINLGDGVAGEVEELWRRGEEVRGWARYWARLYGWVKGRLEANEALRRAVTVVRYEEMCDRGEGVVGEVLSHCGLGDEGGAIARRWGKELSRPTYYEAKFTEGEERAIEEEAGGVWEEIRAVKPE